MIKGIDVSKWQGTIDFSKVKSVADFVVIKATEGVGYVDPKFKTFQKAVRDNGLLLGYYCFSRPDLKNTPQAEVDFLIKTIGDLKQGEIIFLDYEITPSKYAKPVEWCKAWLDHLSYRLNNYKGLVYLNQSLLNGYDWKAVIDSSYGLWLAIYDYNANAPMPETKWGITAFKQYSNKEKIPGIQGNVDGNVFYGTKTTYKKYGFNGMTIPVPDPITPCEKKLKETEKLLDDAIKRNTDLVNQNTIQSDKINALNLKLANNLRGYSKSELFKAYFGQYPDTF